MLRQGKPIRESVNRENAGRLTRMVKGILPAVAGIKKNPPA
jgi:hypothetical protein